MSLNSCNDILDQTPLDSFTSETVWGDLALSEAYLNAQYMNIRAESENGTRFAHYTDEVFQMHTYGSENYTQGLLSPDNCGIGWDDGLWDPWHYYYQAINKINLFIESIDDVPANSEKEVEWKKQQKGKVILYVLGITTCSIAFLVGCLSLIIPMNLMPHSVKLVRIWTRSQISS